MPTPVVAIVPARAALAGNPSDLYGGAVLAVPVFAFAARVEVVDAPAPRITGDEEGRALVAAALARAIDGNASVDVRWSTDIPQAVGLAGSSAIVIATMRAMAIRAGAEFKLDPLEVAQEALRVEAEDLGIVAGLQDRAVQAFGDPVLVDVSGPHPEVTALTPARPLRIAVAWLADAADDSGAYHGALRDRVAGTVMSELADLARAAAAAFSAGDGDALAEAMAASARVRDHVAPLPDTHNRLAAVVSAAGMSPNSAGSGGAVAAVVLDDAALARVTGAVEAIGGHVVVETYA